MNSEKYALNIGCGTKVFFEYPEKSGNKCINYDIRELPGVDVFGDAEKLPFKDYYFSYVVAHDILEHFTINKTEDLLREWRRVLKPHGILELRVPDLEHICKEYLRHREARYTSWVLYGNQDYEYNYHYVCFDRKMLLSILIPIGFKEISYKNEGNNFLMILERVENG